jgi:hypothetical protein
MNRRLHRAACESRSHCLPLHTPFSRLFPFRFTSRWKSVHWLTAFTLQGAPISLRWTRLDVFDDPYFNIKSFSSRMAMGCRARGREGRHQCPARGRFPRRAPDRRCLFLLVIDCGRHSHAEEDAHQAGWAHASGILFPSDASRMRGIPDLKALYDESAFREPPACFHGNRG